MEHATPAVARYRSLREFDGGGAGEGDGWDDRWGHGSEHGPEPSSYWLHASSASLAAANGLADGRQQRSHSMNALLTMVDDFGGAGGRK